jgi:hypothetical protein
MVCAHPFANRLWYTERLVKTMLKNISLNWDAIHAEETRLLRSLSPQEGALQFFALMAEFEAWLQETESVFREERNRALIELQARLATLNIKKRHEQPD